MHWPTCDIKVEVEVEAALVPQSSRDGERSSDPHKPSSSESSAEKTPTSRYQPTARLCFVLRVLCSRIHLEPHRILHIYVQNNVHHDSTDHSGSRLKASCAGSLLDTWVGKERPTRTLLLYVSALEKFGVWPSLAFCVWCGGQGWVGSIADRGPLALISGPELSTLTSD